MEPRNEENPNMKRDERENALSEAARRRHVAVLCARTLLAVRRRRLSLVECPSEAIRAEIDALTDCAAVLEQAEAEYLEAVAKIEAAV